MSPRDKNKRLGENRGPGGKARMRGVEYLLRSPENARRLFGSLYGNRSGDFFFANVDGLRAKLGVPIRQNASRP